MDSVRSQGGPAESHVGGGPSPRERTRCSALEDEHVDLLAQSSCDIAQGWFYGRPVSAAEISAEFAPEKALEEEEAEEG